MTDNEGFQTIEIVYLGKRIVKNDEIGDAYIPLTSLNQIAVGETVLFDRMSSIFSDNKRTKYHVVGAVYDMEVKLEGDRISTCRPSTLKFKRGVNDNRIPQWEAAHVAARMHKKSMAQLSKLKKGSRIEDELINLRLTYNKLPWQDKLAFELMVLSYIRGRK